VTERQPVARRPLSGFPLWDKLKERRAPMSFDLELTARCNLDCRHCYINLPAGDQEARRKELSAAEIGRIAGEAASLGAFWCLVTGGEPLLRKDFFDVYLDLRRKGLLVSVHTNATLVDEEHVRFFRQHPPRDVEVTVYGVTAETYERVTRVAGSFRAFERGLSLLLESGVEVRLKAMALRSNVDELPAIAAFCRARTKDYFRFDPFLHYRLDRDPDRNRDIEAERLTAEEVVSLETADRERFEALERHCDEFIVPEFAGSDCRHLFRCGAGRRNFVVGPGGMFKICSSLVHPDFLYDLRTGSLKEAWTDFTPRALERSSERPDYLDRCARCPVVNLCLWCPANAHLECGELDAPVDSFCRLARAREAALRKGLTRGEGGP
jgi:radical SAM protein with 4Fe4S-binding SPASM domain